MSGVLERLAGGFVPGDFPVAEVLPACPEGLCVTDPEAVLAAHRAAVAADAQCLRTNTRDAKSDLLEPRGLAARCNEINWAAVQIAKTAAKGTGALVAGCVGPVPDTLAARSDVLLRSQIGALLDGGVDLLLFEDFPDAGSLGQALAIKQELHHLPAVCCLAKGACSDAMAEAFAFLAGEGADGLGLRLGSGDAPPPELLGQSDAGWFPVVILDCAPGDDAAFGRARQAMAAAGVRLVFGGRRAAGGGEH
jgi:hypothetical protein